jgi:hypothetical protein
MMPDHEIRLRGPWQLMLLERCGESAEDVVELGQFRAPYGLAERLPDQYAGWVRLERNFQRPSGLSERSRVRLYLNTNLSGQLSVNGLLLGPVAEGEHRYDLQAILTPRNRIRIDVRIDAHDSMRQLTCDARLEIFD